MGRIIGLICIILLVVGGVWWWRNYHIGNQYDGSVVHRDAAMENGTTTMENGQNLGDQAHPTPSRSDAPGTINGDPANEYGNSGNSYDLGTQTSPITQDPNASRDPNAQQLQPGFQRSPSSSHAPSISYNARTPMYPAPMTDNQMPNAPSGLRFGGTGLYQWYRQGNLTYRINTQSGSSCIIYATIEEWRKPNVYRNGCKAS